MIPPGIRTRNVQAADQQPPLPQNAAVAGKRGRSRLAGPANPCRRRSPRRCRPRLRQPERHRRRVPWQSPRRQKPRDDAIRARRKGVEGARHRSGLSPVPASRRAKQRIGSRHRPAVAGPPAIALRALADEAARRSDAVDHRRNGRQATGLARQVAAELANKESIARGMRDADPKGALALLEEAKKKVANSGVEPATRDRLLRQVDRAIAETQQFIDRIARSSNWPKRTTTPARKSTANSGRKSTSRRRLRCWSTSATG